MGLWQAGVIEASDGAAAGIDHVEELDEGKNLGTTSGVVLANKDAHRPSPCMAFSKKKMHEKIFCDPWIVGLDKLRENDVSYDRVEAVRCLDKKSRIRKFILSGIGDMVSKESVVSIGTEQGLSNPCQKYTWGWVNNLNLQ